MDFNIYVLGDVSSFASTLNAVAMIFGQTGFLNSAFMVGGLVMLISGILYMIGKQSDGTVPGVMGPVSGVFGLFAVVWTSTIPTSVIINDIYSNNVAKVDNVPLIISLPASAFTTASYRIFDFTNTAYQGTNGTYMGVSSSGFVMPLKLLFSLRQGFENSDANLAASLKSFILDCTPNSAMFNMDDLKLSSNSVNYVLTHARSTGLTTYWPSSNADGTPNQNPQPQALSCNESAALISQDVNVRYLSGSNKNLNALLNQNMKEKSPNGVSYTQSDVENAYQNITPASWKSTTDSLHLAQGARDFMLNALTYNTVANTFNCMESNADQSSFNMCNVQMTQAFEQSRTDSAAAGSFFSKMMMPAMIFMQLMFFGFAPLIVIYGVMKGGGALGMYVKYLLFGIWTSSWLPFSAVIQMYIQNDVADKLAEIKTGMLTVGNFAPVYYEILASRLSVASDMLAATPLVSLAMLTGSAMAVTSLAGRWSGRDHVDETQSSPSILRNDPITGVGNTAQFGPSILGNALTGPIRADANLRTYTSGQVLENSMASSDAQIATKRAEASSSFDSMISWMKSHSTGSRTADADISSIGKDVADRTSEVQKRTEAAMNNAKFSNDQRKAFTKALNAQGGISSPFGSINASLQAASSVGMSAEQAKSFSDTMSKDISSDKSWSDSITARAQHSAESYTGDEVRTARSLSNSLKQSVSSAEQAQKQYQETVAMKVSLGGDSKIEEGVLGSQLMNNPAARELLESADKSLAGNSQYQALLKSETGRIHRAGDITLKDDVAKFAALFDMSKGKTADSANAGKALADVVSALNGMNAPDKFNPAVNEGVAPAANKVPNDPAHARKLSLKDPHVLSQKGRVPVLPSGVSSSSHQPIETAPHQSPSPVAVTTEAPKAQADEGDTTAPMAVQTPSHPNYQGPNHASKAHKPVRHSQPSPQPAVAPAHAASTAAKPAANPVSTSPSTRPATQKAKAPNSKTHSNLKQRAERLMKQLDPNFNQEKNDNAANTSNVAQDIQQAKQDISNAKPNFDPQAIRQNLNQTATDVKNIAAGVGMAWNDFERNHKAIALGIEAAMVAVPLVRGAGMAMKLGSAAKASWKAVVESRAAVKTAASEVMKLSSAIRNEGSALTGFKQTVDPKQMAKLGIKNEAEFAKRWESANANLVKAEKGVLSHSKAYAQEFNAANGAKSESMVFAASTATKQAGSIVKNGPVQLKLLNLSQQEAQIYRQESYTKQQASAFRKHQ